MNCKGHIHDNGIHKTEKKLGRTHKEYPFSSLISVILLVYKLGEAWNFVRQSYLALSVYCKATCVLSRWAQSILFKIRLIKFGQKTPKTFRIQHCYSKEKCGVANNLTAQGKLKMFPQMWCHNRKWCQASAWKLGAKLPPLSSSLPSTCFAVSPS